MVKPRSRLEKREAGFKPIQNPLTFLGIDLSTEKNVEDFTNICIAIIASGASVKENLKINHHTLEYIYSIAFAFYQEARYKKSLPLFNLLALLDHENFKYIFALAANYQMMGNLKAAMRFYDLAYTVEPDNPVSIFRLAECAVKVNKVKPAITLFEMAIEIAGSRKKYSELKKRSELVVKELKF